MSALRRALRAKYGARGYRINRHDLVEVRREDGLWVLLGDLEFIEWRLKHNQL
jgi:hypothetical protein